MLLFIFWEFFMYKFFYLSFFLLHSLFSLEIIDVGRDWRDLSIEESFRGVVAFADEIKEYDRDNYTYLYTIEDNHLTVKPPLDQKMFHFLQGREKAVTAAFNRILRENPSLPDMSLLVHLGDAFIRVDKSDYVPIFTFSKKRNDCAVIVMPDFELLSNHQSLIDEVSQGCTRYSWNSKMAQAFWRGSTTSGDFSQPNWREFSRSQLVLTARDSNKRVNAHFTQFCQGAENNNDFLTEIGHCYPHIDVESHLVFKYLIDVDGNASTYSRFYWILLSNSAPFKVESEFTQWYYKGLEPYKHYVPVNHDSSNLISQVEWARENDEKVESIAKASREFAIEHLNEDSVHDYLYLLLKRYSQVYIP